MGGELQFASLEIVVELLGVDDVELLVSGLKHIQQYQIKVRNAEADHRH